MAAKGYRILRRPWRVRRPLYWGMAFELLGIVAVLVLFGIQQPDVFRTQFWEIGHLMKWNSSPNMILYAYANHQPLPKIPFVWSQLLTNFNVAISVVSLFVLLVKMIMIIMKFFYPILGLIVSLSLTVLYAVSAYGQAGPDYADPKYPSPVPWYIAKSCSVARPFNAEKNCQIAKGAFAATIYLMFLYLCNFILSIWSMWPNKMLDMYDDDDDDSSDNEQETKSPSKGKQPVVNVTALHGGIGIMNSNGNSPGTPGYYGNKEWEMQPTMHQRHQQQPPTSPRAMHMSGAGGGGGGGGYGYGGVEAPLFTPRTQAFHTLDRRLPLRSG
ncbi:hypothetical protein SMACR_00214 [Sordaria macrospora]|uniref:WGS project CABT00000000 data, contig 2.1 n=2 Tax=Sordaria macrospora TaxID=5147 RepID=F7VKH1_SORMK|nr:uncharacterized protein SMAC_00214 [Sordaria macrospora k-hell]KAA8636787.1 hypothetical protein SMACR_00214 [Sordaria macrospora]KAH7634238.1 hypothetical protein B0T09DRAFT_1513 [Sordaria sp. MPI-SDFR-AT-0083]WPJ58957.1 hypothetical protein SMAC4_00214 [Sordaria macrospora]CCC05998.1 unnamed protein product [Sordaria macrospora k-hell]